MPARRTGTAANRTPERRPCRPLEHPGRRADRRDVDRDAIGRYFLLDARHQVAGGQQLVVDLERTRQPVILEERSGELHHWSRAGSPHPSKSTPPSFFAPSISSRIRAFSAFSTRLARAGSILRGAVVASGDSRCGRKTAISAIPFLLTCPARRPRTSRLYSIVHHSSKRPIGARKTMQSCGLMVTSTASPEATPLAGRTARSSNPVDGDHVLFRPDRGTTQREPARECLFYPDRSALRACRGGHRQRGGHRCVSSAAGRRHRRSGSNGLIVAQDAPQ